MAERTTPVKWKAPGRPRRGRLHGAGTARLGTALIAVFGLCVSTPAAADELEPFEASYNWIWHGLTVAESHVQLQRSGDTWTYRTKSEPRGIGKVFSERPAQESVMRVTDSGVEPLSYKADDGTSSTKRDADVKFDWQSHRVTGVYEDTQVDMPITPGIQDDLSVQIALMAGLLKNAPPDHFSLLNGNSVREYRYTREREETLQTPLGNIATVVYRSEKANSPRVTRFWCAPSKGYIPVKVEQTRKDDVEWTMQILSLKRGD
jgi:Protein of unknown function (DUF3108)